MYDSTNPLSAISYTNKDFQTIYPELLETVKKLTYKWDPTISNESDPGVILIKLNALIADKNNYNIDKNVLENYPETYTQELSARSQYKQLGYRMPWYRAAKTTVRFKWNKKDRDLQDGEYITIPRYTMVTDSDNDKIYTTLNDLIIGRVNNGDGTGSVEAMQGVITTLNIAGEENITLSNLDSKNRLYINDYNIAENGIFITNTSDIHHNLWKQVDNVEVQPNGTPCYEFDIDPRSNVCYLQFPDDVRNLIGSGLTIRYLITRGYEGNIAAKTLTSFYEDVKSSIKLLGNDVEAITINNDTVLLYNSSSTDDGKDPETIEQAFKSYKHVVATFDTLVTLRDYMNAIYNSDLVSNVIVTDRTTDIQSSYKIVNKDPAAVTTHKIYMVEDDQVVTYFKVDANDSSINVARELYKNVDSEMCRATYSEYQNGVTCYLRANINKYMNAFDLKYYLLGRGATVSTLDEYDNTFDIDDSLFTLEKINTVIENSKSIQHDVKPIQKFEPFMLQNIYPINLKIVPSYKLSEIEMNDVRTNIQSTLRNLLQSRNIDFGSEPQYDIIYDTIRNCDERIKVVMMDDFDYTTYALYLDDVERIEFNGDKVSKTVKGNVYKKIPINNFDATNMVVVDTVKTDKVLLQDFNVKARDLRAKGEKPEDYLFIDLYHGRVYLYDKELQKGNQIYLYSDRIHDVRKTVVVKNILAGVTPLFDPQTKFNIGIDMQQNENLSGNTDTITTSLEIAPFGYDYNSDPLSYDPQKRDAEYILSDNENLRFLAPSLTTDRNFSSYVKYELVMKAPTGDVNYVYADPDDETELLRKYGINNFYRNNGYDTYSKITSHDYDRVTQLRPQFKLDTYFTSLFSGSDVNLSNLTPAYGEVEKVTTLSGFKTYDPEFEPYMYYSEPHEDEFVLLQNPPCDWPAYGKYYKLKQFEPEFAKVAIAVEDLESSDDDYIVYENYLVPKYDSSKTYYVLNSGEYEEYNTVNVTESNWAKTAVDNDLYILENKVHNNPTHRDCYEKITGKFSNYYEKDQYGYYHMVYNGTQVSGKTYYKLNGAPSNWQDTSAPSKNVSVYLQYVRNGVLQCDLMSPAIPCFVRNTYYVADDTVGYRNYTLLTQQPSDWGTNYSNYFIMSDTTEGLGINSAEYDQWKKGRLTLYVPEGTYKISADTDYQLREGDYITFFWREEDADDAPYQYIRYDHIYDKDNNLPTIIRPNFTITGSSYGNCKVDPVKLLSSGSIKYSAAADSPFQKIYLELVTDYDLSGTKSIDLRKMNSKALEGTNYIYFISKEEDKVNEKYVLRIPETHRITEDGKTKVTYRYTLQNDEHFVYTNDKKDAFEALSAGTMVQLTRVFESGMQLPIIGEPAYFEVDCVKISDVMYYGIDTFKDQCIGIQKHDNWLLIEQQIYSFTAGDTISIHLEDNFQNDYERCKSNDIGNYSELYELCSVYNKISPVYDIVNGEYNKCVPEFFSGKYYTEKDGAYTVLMYRPSDWPSVWPSPWPTTPGEDGKLWTEKYYELVGSEYKPVTIDESVENSFVTNYSNYYTLNIQDYPVYSTNEYSYVRNYTVQYKSGGSAFTDLPKINVLNDEYQWCVTAHLNMSFDNDNHQKILPNKELKKGTDDIWLPRKSKQSITINGEVYNDNTKPLYLLADVLLDKVGGNNVDVTYMSGNSEEPVSIEVLAYQLNPMFNEKPWGYTTSGQVRLSVTPGVTNKVYTIDGITLDKSNTVYDGETDTTTQYTFKYILPISVDSEYITYTITTVGGKNAGIKSSINSKKNICGKGINYFYIPVDTESINIKVTASHEMAEEDDIVFDFLYKYTDREIFEKEYNMSVYGSGGVLDTIRNMDVPDCFDYTYRVDKSVLIKDPLDPTSLFDTNHVYNQFSIAKAEIRMNKKNGTSVTFVNNR